jgi:hypothetical protein
MDRQARGGAIGFAIGLVFWLGYTYGLESETTYSQDQAGWLIVIICAVIGVLVTKNKK